MQALFLKLLAVHLIADFLFQSKQMVVHKNKHGIRSGWLYIHSLLHAVLTAILLFNFSLSYVYVYLLVFTSHLLIDVVKTYFLSGFRGFIIDQCLHMLMLAGISAMLFPQEIKITFQDFDTEKAFVLFIALSLNTYVASIAIGIFMQRWRLGALNHSSLPQAGAYIGILERLLIFLFINLNFYAAIGFLLAAKSVFRFGDLSKSKDRKLTEYILVGTLMSFMWGILSALLLKWL